MPSNALSRGRAQGITIPNTIATAQELWRWANENLTERQRAAIRNTVRDGVTNISTAIRQRVQGVIDDYTRPTQQIASRPRTNTHTRFPNNELANTHTRFRGTEEIQTVQENEELFDFEDDECKYSFLNLTSIKHVYNSWRYE